MTKLSSDKVESFIKDLDYKPELRQEFNANPTETLIKNAGITVIKDAWVYRLVVTALSLIILIIVIGFLIKGDQLQNASQVFTILTSLVSLSIGALTGLLAPNPKNQ